MHSELNTSSYYRANPFYQQGYVPDSALRNRKSPNYIAEIPQGQKYFEPSNRKHFQRLGYYSTIAEDKIIQDDSRDNEQPARDKEFFRSLNIQDIEGAAPNTIMSQAVKNRMKAQEHLMKRNQEQREEEAKEKIRVFSQIEDNRRRQEALAKIRREKQPNYHELVKRMRTEESEGMPSPQHQRIKQQPNVNQQTNQNNQYHSQLQQTEYEILELEKQLRQVRKQNEKNSQQLNAFRPLPNEQRADTQKRDNKYHKNEPTSAMNEYNPIEYNPNRYPSDNNPIKRNPSQNLQPNPQKMNYPHLTNNEQQYYNYNNVQPNIETRQRSLTDKAMPKPNTYKQQLLRKQQEQNYQDSRSRKESRQQHRRYNPTYLSFGSASIGLAGKNIVGI